MKYRHAFHAGNFADVHKHVTLVALFESLQRKDKGFLLVDTHAGNGSYDLGGPDARQGDEASMGIERLLQDTQSANTPDIEQYLGLVRALRAESGHRHAYPGSPWIAARLLRAQDRAVLIESQTDAFVELRRNLRDAGGCTFENGDGYARLPALLPPAEKRGLALIDPPYEDARQDQQRIAQSLERSLERFATGVYVIWYPIKLERDVERWQANLVARLARPMLSCELWLYPRDNRAGLNGSGMLIINPPYRFDEIARASLPRLVSALAPVPALGGWSVRDPARPQAEPRA